MSSRRARSWSTFTYSVASLSVAVFVGGGCGDDSQGEPIDSAATAISALAEGDGEKACKELTPEAQQEVVARAPALLGVPTSPNCADLITRAAHIVAPYKDRLEDPSFLNVSVNGDVATLTFVGAGFPIAMEKRDGDWLISASTIQSAAARSAQDPR